MEDSFNLVLTESFLPDAKLEKRVASFVLERIIRVCTKHFLALQVMPLALMRKNPNIFGSNSQAL